MSAYAKASDVRARPARERGASETPSRTQQLLDTVRERLTTMEPEVWEATWRLYARSRYSPRNLLLANAQIPHAAGIFAGYQGWRERGFQVRRGERGALILAPIVRQVQQPARATDPEAMEAPQDDAADETVEEKQIVGFRTVVVFDISQVDPVTDEAKRTSPAILGELLGLETDLPSHMLDDLYAIAAREGLTVREEPMAPLGVHGWLNANHNEIVLPKNGTPTAKALVLGHELTHWFLRHYELQEEYANDPRVRARAELEAETAAAVLLASWGVDEHLRGCGVYVQHYLGHLAVDERVKALDETMRSIQYALTRLPMGSVFDLAAQVPQNEVVETPRVDATPATPARRARVV